MRLALTILLAATVTTHAQTDGTYLLRSTNTVGPSSPFATIEVWATWLDPGEQFRFARGDYNLTASDGAFSNPVNVLNGPGTTTGVIVGNMISGARNGQILIPTIPPIPIPFNPVLLAVYDWSTTDFTPRTVSLDTSNTSVFTVGIPRIGEPPILSELFPNNFTPGSGIITIVPAPAAWVVLALPLVARRRRG
jgi:hypothetical protein